MRKLPLTLAMVLAIALTGCTTPDSESPAAQTAIDYLIARDEGNKERQCDLKEDAQGTEERAHCIEVASDGGFTDYPTPPVVDRVEEWPSVGDHAKVIIVKETLSTDDHAEWVAVGVVEVDGQWLVRSFRPIEGDPQREGAGAETLG